jgi:hypothetical protein
LTKPGDVTSLRRLFANLRGSERNRDSVDRPTSGVLAENFRVFEQLDDVVNDIVNFAAANDAPGLEGKYPFNQLLHSFEVHYPIRFPRFTTVG